MTKLLLVYTLLTLSTATHAQGPDNPIPSTINNSKTNRHVTVPGTRVFIIPPDGFTYSAKDETFSKGDNNFISVEEVAGNDFNASNKNFTRERFQKEGDRVFNFKDLKVNGYAARMVISQPREDTTSKSYILVFGDAGFTVKVQASCLIHDIRTEKQISRFFESIVFDKTKVIGAFENVPFQLDATGTVFRLAKHFSSDYYFSKQWDFLYRFVGTPEGLPEEEPYFKVICRPDNGINYSGSLPAQDILEPFIKKGLTDIIFENESTDTVNGLPSYRDDVYGAIKGKKMLIFRHVLLIDRQLVYMEGVAYADFPKYLAAFNKISNSLRIK